MIIKAKLIIFLAIQFKQKQILAEVQPWNMPVLFSVIIDSSFVGENIMFQWKLLSHFSDLQVWTQF